MDNFIVCEQSLSNTLLVSNTEAKFNRRGKEGKKKDSDIVDVEVTLLGGVSYRTLQKVLPQLIY